MGRLMKYELRSTMKLFAPLWLAVLALAVINRFTFFRSTRVLTPAGAALANSRLAAWLTGLAMVLYVVAIIGVFVVALIFVILRFYQGLLKDEGYLTFTLPVRTDTILWAKTFSAVILIAGSVIVCILSVLVLNAERDFWSNLAEGWRNAVRLAGGGSLIQTIVLAVIAALASVIPGVQYLYLSMSIGHLAQKHRVGASVLAYVGIQIVLNSVSSLLISPAVEWLVSFDSLRNWSIGANGTIWILFGIVMAVLAIETAIFYFPTRYILTRHLNLE